jgi:alkaline phosphatase D
LPFCIQSAGAAAQYKKIGTNAMSDVVDGKYDGVIEDATAYLDEHPKDLESMYILAIAYANQGGIDKALDYAGRAVAAGLPFGRFLAGPRDLLQALTTSRGFKSLRKKHAVQLLHGPMLGCVTHNCAKLWLRTAEETRVRLSVRKRGSGPRSAVRVTGQTDAANDFTAVLVVEGLEADTLYDYELQAQGDKRATEGAFRTAPTLHRPARFRVGFGGGAGYTPQHEKMWNAINSHDPLAFLFLGDNVYIDNPTRPAVQRYCYYRRQSRPEYRAFAGSTSIYAIWDDHDFTTNDAGGGPLIREPQWKIPVWNLFKENWVNPYYAGDSEECPGCYFDFYIADVHFIMMDCRYYRHNPRNVENPSMLGPIQLEWLFRTLKSSTGNFKILVSSVPWAYGAKPGSKDPWQGFRQERERIFTYLSDNEIEGVVLLSADRHRSDLWKIERPDGYPLYEFESSRLTNIHTHGVMKGSLFGYNEKCSFGLLTFDTKVSNPMLTYDIISIDDELIHSFTVKRSQLTHSGQK